MFNKLRFPDAMYKYVFSSDTSDWSTQTHWFPGVEWKIFKDSQYSGFHFFFF